MRAVAYPTKPVASQPTKRTTPVTAAATRIVQEALREDVSVTELSDYACVDPAFALRILSVVNSPYVGLGRKVDDVRQASLLLGIRGLRTLALSTVVAGLGTPSELQRLLLGNCIRRAVAARAIAASLKDADVESHFTTGLLLDVGFLAEAENNPEGTREIADSPALHRITRERAAGRVPHTEQGAALARQYGLAPTFTDAILRHHDAQVPNTNACAVAWIAERCAAVYEGGDIDANRKTAQAAARQMHLPVDVLDALIDSLPERILDFSRILDRDLGPQLDLESLRSRAHEGLALLNAQYESLVRSLESTIAEKDELERELRQANEQLARLASTDDLTGLANRRALQEALVRDLARADRDNTVLSVLMLDIDRFKAINDTHGHAQGDAVLRELGALLQGSLRASDVAGRYGGEEFLCILPCTDTQGALVVAQRIRSRLAAQSFGNADQPFRVTTSIGVATVGGPGCRSQEEQLLRRADDSLYQAKREGRDRVVCAS